MRFIIILLYKLDKFDVTPGMSVCLYTYIYVCFCLVSYRSIDICSLKIMNRDVFARKLSPHSKLKAIMLSAGPNTIFICKKNLATNLARHISFLLARGDIQRIFFLPPLTSQNRPYNVKWFRRIEAETQE